MGMRFDLTEGSGRWGRQRYPEGVRLAWGGGGAEEVY